jgi:hypothetical protein
MLTSFGFRYDPNCRPKAPEYYAGRKKEEAFLLLLSRIVIGRPSLLSNILLLGMV